MILTESYPDMNLHFSQNEMISMSGPDSIEKIMQKILENPGFIEYVASRSLQRFKLEYEAKVVLKRLLDDIGAV